MQSITTPDMIEASRKQFAWTEMLKNFQHLTTQAQVGFLVQHKMLDGVEVHSSCGVARGAVKRQENTRALRLWFELNWDKVKS
jgi:hypothetical protein